MARRVVYRPLARDDLKAIYDWLDKEAGPAVAWELIEAIEERCDTLALLPGRGTPRPEIAEGVRSIPFRRRGVIAYRVDPEEVVIIGIMYGGRDLSALSARERLA